MIPLYDTIPHRRLPIVSMVIILINVIVFFYELSFGARLEEFFSRYGFVPVSVFVDGNLVNSIKTIFSSMFIHGSFMHLLGNMWYMWIFADNVEDRLGHFNFFIFYCLSGFIAAFIHFLTNINSQVPAVGASGAIAGVLGAYMVLFPTSRIVALIPFLIFWTTVEIPALVYLGLWFIFQFLWGLGTIGMGVGIAFWAHVGGFIGGILLLRIFLDRNTAEENAYY